MRERLRRLYWRGWSATVWVAWWLFAWCDVLHIPGRRARLWIWTNL